MGRFLAVAAAVMAVALLPTTAIADVPEHAEWTEAYIETPGQPTLHADVLRPKGLPETAKTPVILSIGPYFGHSGAPIEETNPDQVNHWVENVQAPPPSDRFDDMIEGGKVFQRGYTVVYVDLRGFGASAGCNDFGGPGEQNDAKRAVEWAAAQPWSTGKVGMWGKSYDAWTQVMALDEKPNGLAAAIIQSPIIDGYRTLYQAGVHYQLSWYITPGLYQGYDAMPPNANDDAEYVLHTAQGTNPACYAQNIALQNGLHDHDDAAGFWKERDLPNARGSDVPVLWSHGFLDANTKPDNFLSVWETLRGPTRAWFGQYAHDRGNEVDKVGKAGFMEEAFRWLDRYVKGDASIDVNRDPRTTIQEGNGKWRAEEQWPPADAVVRTMGVRSGTYIDDDANTATAPDSGIWSFSQASPHTTHIAGLMKARLEVVNPAPRANLIALLYDVGPSGDATLVTRGAVALGSSSEPQSVEFEMYPNDYRLPAGHRLGLFISGSDEMWYTPPHSQADVEVRGGQVLIPLLRYSRDRFLPGGEAAAIAERPVTTLQQDFNEAAVTMDFGPPMIPGGPPSTKGGVKRPPAGRPAGERLRLSHKVRSGRRLQLRVSDAGTFRVAVTVKRGKRVVTRKSGRPRNGTYRVVLRLRRPGIYTVIAKAKGRGAPKSVKRRIRVK